MAIKKIIPLVILAVTGGLSAAIFENGNFEKGSSKWHVPGKIWKIEPGVGRKGSAALVWENNNTNQYCFPLQEVSVEPGGVYRYGGWVRIDALKKGVWNGGPDISIEWIAADGTWLGNDHARRVTDNDVSTEGWTRFEGRTPPLPANAAIGRFVCFLRKGSVGRVRFDDFHFEPQGVKWIDYLVSSAYRDTAWEGDVEFAAAINVNTVRHPLESVVAEFTFIDSDGKSITCPAQKFDAHIARIKVPVSNLVMGEQRVMFNIRPKVGGKAYATARIVFTRTAERVKRHVDFDSQGRTLIDGKRVFLLGCFGKGMTDERIAIYKKGPFNYLMQYGRLKREHLDKLGAAGIFVASDARTLLYDCGYFEDGHPNTREESMALIPAKIKEVGDHPALIAWYVVDESPLSCIPAISESVRLFHKLDPDRPTYAVLDKPEHVRAFLPCYDVLGMDPYPIGNKGDRADISIASAWAKEAREEMFGFRPMWQVPQIFDWSWYRKREQGETGEMYLPTREEIANMSWQAIAGGANGIGYYAFHAYFRFLKGEAFDRAWATVCDVAWEIKAREEILNSDDYPGTVGGNLGGAVARAWKGKSGTWLLLVNPTRCTLTAMPNVGAWSDKIELAPLESRWVEIPEYPVPSTAELRMVRAKDIASARQIAKKELRLPVSRRRIVAATKNVALAIKREFPELKVCLTTTSAKHVNENYDYREVRDAEAFSAVAAKMDYLEFDRIFPDDVAAALYDAGVATIAHCGCNEADLKAAADLGVKHVVTEDQDKAKCILETLAKRMTGMVDKTEFRVRDPFILPVKENETYYLYETVPWNVSRGVQVRTSKDLKIWSAPKRVVTMPESARTFRVCAPEVHAHKGKYYLFATAILHPDPKHPIKSMAPDPNFVPPPCYPLTRSGTWIFAADTPEGPFVQLSDMSATPHDYMALDGTLVVDPDGSPWMVYSQEWTQTQIGRLLVGRLKDDMSGLVGPMRELFKANSAFGPNYVMDGPFCYRSPRTGLLSMIWSKFCDSGYSVISCSSQTGKAEGPWSDFRMMFAGNGGHGMIFKTFEGDLRLVMHKPEIRGYERLTLFSVEEDELGRPVIKVK